MQTAIEHIFSKAYSRFGLGAFNVFNAEQVHGVFRGAQLSQMPVIIQITPVARNYMSPEVLQAIILSVANQYQDVEFSVHLDHGNYEHCIDAIQSGFYDSVMIDASHESFEENVLITSEIVNEARKKNVAVEAELGVLSGVEDDLSIDSCRAFYTDPEQAKEFVERTGCNSLAVAVGTSHGAYKFSGGQGLQIEILRKINELLPGFPLVLHGASAVPAEEVEQINQNGGLLKTGASGLKEEELLEAIRLGVCKINIATDMRLIWTRVHREFFKATPELFDMVVPGKTYMNELSAFVAKKCTMLKSNLLKAC
ncbi:class II fructose-bisphosphate aldolase [Roseimarinus sediminis]|uniref:class II fructose-bisphosphate aldolase n=1 Tax=Roseimarinus sediminis TaxID=1610899 RepID=UPI003D207B7C